MFLLVLTMQTSSNLLFNIVNCTLELKMVVAQCAFRGSSRVFLTLEVGFVASLKETDEALEMLLTQDEHTLAIECAWGVLFWPKFKVYHIV